MDESSPLLQDHDELPVAQALPPINLIKLSDVISDIEKALKNDANAKERLNSVILFTPNETFPFTFAEEQIDLRSRYKIIQYLNVLGHISDTMYLQGLKKLSEQFKDSIHLADKVVLAKIERQQMFKTPNDDVLERLNDMKQKFSGVNVNGHDLYDKKFGRYEESFNGSAKAGEDAYIDKNKNKSITKGEVTALFIKQSANNVFFPAEKLLEISRGFFVSGGRDFRSRPWRASSYFGMGILTGIGIGLTTVLGGVAFLGSLLSLLPGPYQLAVKPWAQRKEVTNRIENDRAANTPNGLHVRVKEKQDIQTQPKLAEYAKASVNASLHQDRLKGYDSNIENNRKGLSGLKFFGKSARAAVESHALEESYQQGVASGHNDNGRQSTK